MAFVLNDSTFDIIPKACGACLHANMPQKNKIKNKKTVHSSHIHNKKNWQYRTVKDPTGLAEQKKKKNTHPTNRLLSTSDTADTHRKRNVVTTRTIRT